MEVMQNNLFELLATIITFATVFIGMSIKKAYTKYVDTKTKKEIVKGTVEYVEQIYKNLMVPGKEKLTKAKEKVVELITSKGLKISDSELEVLIESAVRGLKKENWLKNQFSFYYHNLKLVRFLTCSLKEKNHHN